MPLFKCPYLNNNMCMIASTKSHIECFPSPDECKKCSKATPPRDDNLVTIQIIKRTFEQYHSTMPEHMEKLGPGTKLKLLVSKWANPNEECYCIEAITIINNWGSEAINHLEEIEEMLLGGAQLSDNKLISFFSNLFPYITKLIARRAIRIAIRNYK